MTHEEMAVNLSRAMMTPIAEVGSLLAGEIDALKQRVDALEHPENADVLTLKKPRQWVNEERTVLVTMWTNHITVSRRDDPSCVWGPPLILEEERVT